jgi:hypothetical protein
LIDLCEAFLRPIGACGLAIEGPKVVKTGVYLNFLALKSALECNQTSFLCFLTNELQPGIFFKDYMYSSRLDFVVVMGNSDAKMILYITREIRVKELRR